jgi:hypothetical protein
MVATMQMADANCRARVTARVNAVEVLRANEDAFGADEGIELLVYLSDLKR